MNKIQAREQYLKLIFLEHNKMSEGDQHFEDLEYLNAFISNS